MLTINFFDHDAAKINERGNFSRAFDHRSANPELDVSRAKVVALRPQAGPGETQILVFPPTIKLITIIRTLVDLVLVNQTIYEGFVIVGEGGMKIEWGSGKANDQPPEELQKTIRNEIERLLFGNG